MSNLLTLIRDWVPSVVIIVAGIWLLFQWLFGEWLRRRKEIPALDGKLPATIISAQNGKLVITIEGLRNNHSPLPVYLSIEKCRLVVYRIEAQQLIEKCVGFDKRSWRAHLQSLLSGGDVRSGLFPGTQYF
jgi:hypothetical protein